MGVYQKNRLISLASMVSITQQLINWLISQLGLSGLDY